MQTTITATDIVERIAAEGGAYFGGNARRERGVFVTRFAEGAYDVSLGAEGRAVSFLANLTPEDAAALAGAYLRGGLRAVDRLRASEGGAA